MMRIASRVRRVIGVVTCMVLPLVGAAGCLSHQVSPTGIPIAGRSAPDRSRSAVSPYVDSTACGSHVTIVDLTKKFLFFFDSSSKTPLDRDARWAL
jgi:hypothetical protein